jgi:hypothetical protein
MENDVGSCTLKLYIGADSASATTFVKSFDVTSANVKIKAAKMNVRRAKVPNFYINVEKDCDGYNPKTAEGGAAKAGVNTVRGRLRSLAAITTKLSNQARAIMLR